MYDYLKQFRIKVSTLSTCSKYGGGVYTVKFLTSVEEGISLFFVCKQHVKPDYTAPTGPVSSMVYQRGQKFVFLLEHKMFVLMHKLCALP